MFIVILLSFGFCDTYISPFVGLTASSALFSGQNCVYLIWEGHLLANWVW